MKKVAVIFAFGMEEIEAITPVDVLRRGGAEVNTIAVGGEYVIGSHGIKIFADKTVEETNFDIYDGIIIPGGMPGATNIACNKKVVCALKDFIDKGKVVGAICASPAVVLGANGLIKDKKATCYPMEDFIKVIENSYTGSEVEIDGNLVTANGPKSALKFANALCEKLNLPKL